MIHNKHCKMIAFSDWRKDDICLGLIMEDLLSLRMQGKSHTVIMQTPGDEIAHVAGFCLGEGLVDSMDDFLTIGYCKQDINEMTVTLKPERVHRIPGILQRKGFISQTSCGICGKELIDDLAQNLKTLLDRLLIEVMGRETGYAVRDTAIINDATVEDAEKSGLGEVARIISSGCDAPGDHSRQVLARISGGFRGGGHDREQGAGKLRDAVGCGRAHFLSPEDQVLSDRAAPGHEKRRHGAERRAKGHVTPGVSSFGMAPLESNAL